MKKNIENRIIAFLIFLFLLISFSSCDLDPKIYSSYSETNFPVTEEDARQLLIGIYANFKCNSGGANHAAYGGWVWPLMTTGRGGWWGQGHQTTDETYNLEAQGSIFNWADGFDTYNSYTVSRAITHATNVIDVIQKNETIDENTKKGLIAEAKCLRAWAMFCFYDIYGPIPYIIDPNKLDDIKYEPRPSKEEYFNQMVKDLTEAMPDLLDKTNGTSDWGKVNKGVATMLLMKLYMNDHQFDKALPYAESMLTLGYKLSDDYKIPFSEGHEHDDEVIWAVPSGAQAGSEWFFYAIPPDCGNVLGQDVNPYWGVFVMRWNFYDTFDKTDKRLAGIADNYITTKGEIATREGPNKGTRLDLGAIALKYFYSTSSAAKGDIHMVIFRYADVLLSLAEIENELNGPTDKALGYLKQITDRAGVSHTIPADIQTSKETFNEFLLMERGHELYFEGWRRQDLIRHGEFINQALANGYNNAADHMILFPIPRRIINESGGIIEQNPGY